MLCKVQVRHFTQLVHKCNAGDAARAAAAPAAGVTRLQEQYREVAPGSQQMSSQQTVGASLQAPCCLGSLTAPSHRAALDCRGLLAPRQEK